jgi:hypothetical protein
MTQMDFPQNARSAVLVLFSVPVDESFPSVHTSAGCDFAVDDRDHACGSGRL